MNIGKVTIVDTWYDGEDHYSDGAVEDRMESIASDVPKEEWNREIAKQESWPVLYHFSHLRENIVRWYPFSGKERVLEIGAGCGAVTGALCEAAGSVDAVELSMKRSRINALRNKEAANLAIYVGNFQEVEPHLDELYDVITLIGVLEYAESYISTGSGAGAALRLLQTAARHLKPDGEMLLAIENRFGLKYFAGCAEDHTAEIFEGLEGYRDPKGIRTYTKGELTGLLTQAGLNASWYYPFPDYKFPQVLHSDDRLPKRGELTGGISNFDLPRMRLYDEDAILNMMVEEGVYPQFANSFLLVLRKTEKTCQDPYARPVYAKFSNERAPKYAVMTTIHQGKDGGRYVRKQAMTEAACPHVCSLVKKAAELAPVFAMAGFFSNQCLAEEGRAKDTVRLEYLEGTTLQERLDGLLESRQLQEAADLLLAYADRIRSLAGRRVFTVTEPFRRMFGEADLPAGLLCNRTNDIDLIPANILLTGDRDVIVDQEWTCFFPVPIDFIVFRFLWYYLETEPKRKPLKDLDLYGKAGLAQEWIPVFLRMEERFQKVLLEDHVPLRELYDAVSPGQVDILPYYRMLCSARKERQLQVFADRGNGISEKESSFYGFEKKEKKYLARIPIPEGSIALRLDPGEEPCALRVCRMAFEGNGEETEAALRTNGHCLEDGLYLFPRRDPQIWITDIPQDVDRLCISLVFLPIETVFPSFPDYVDGLREQNGQIQKQKEEVREELDKALGEAARTQEQLDGIRQELADARRELTDTQKELADARTELEGARELISRMENTKVWRLYRWLKRENS